MRYATFGRSGLRVSELVLGAMTFGEQVALARRSRSVDASSTPIPRPAEMSTPER